MEEFLTWASLGTYAGAVMFTAMVTQLFKGVGFISRIPTRLFSYIVAVVVLVLATLFAADTPAVQDFVLCFINGAIVSLAANGAFDGINEVTK